MGHEFEQVDEITVDATPEQVWQAIATGPGIDSWFMGRNDVDEAAGTVRQWFGGYEPEHRITGWEPMRRLAYGDDAAPDGRFVAYEFLIEGRDRSSTVLRMATSGFLPGDDWADEFEAMTHGGALFIATLRTYLTHFAGRTGVPLTLFGPVVTDWPAAARTLGSALGLSGPARVGDRVSLSAEGLPPAEGEVYFVNEQTLGVRTGDALYRFMRGFHGPVVACHSLFAAGDGDDNSHDLAATELAWQNWLTKTLS